MNYKRAQIISVGAAVPERVLTNQDFEKYLDTSDEWIVRRTGIRKRHFVTENMPDAATALGAQAVSSALENAQLRPQDLDGIICATFTQDHLFPSTACEISKKLDCSQIFAFDLFAACTGFIYGLTIANSLILSGQYNTIAVVGTEVISRYIDWNDRATCVLFGDAAGAAIVQGSEDADHGILSCSIKSDNSYTELLQLSALGDKRYMCMNGREVFKIAVRIMADSTLESLKTCNLTLDDIDFLIPHQANVRIIDAIGQRLKLPSEKVISNVESYGNTSSASIPLALKQAWDEGKIRKNTLVALAALGGGVTYGSAVIRF